MGTALARQHLRNILATLDVPTLGQPEAFILAKEGLFDEGVTSAQTTGNFCRIGWITMSHG
jgi:chromate reductase